MDFIIGLPKVIWNYDSIFVVVEKLTKVVESTYHPKLDGQIERVNQVIEDMVRYFYSQKSCQWLNYLPLVEFYYNYSYNRSLQISPFKALYGY